MIAIEALLAFWTLILVAAVILCVPRRHDRGVEITGNRQVELHAVRRQFEVSQHRLEARSEAARLRRELDRELDRFDKQDGT